MNRLTPTSNYNDGGVPRRRGDEPDLRMLQVYFNPRSPQARG